MRNNTQKIYERLSRGEFLSVDSADASTRHLYEDIEENYEDYADYFKEIAFGWRQAMVISISRELARESRPSNRS